jgi:hypothetical protein
MSTPITVTNGRVDLNRTFFLHSNPTATKTIFLDFDGHTTTRTNWNNASGKPTIITPAFNNDTNPTAFSNAELERIQFIWQRVAEDYMPFGINVTTQDPGDAAIINSGGTDNYWGIRVAIGGSNKDWHKKGSATGVGYYNSFGLQGYGPVCFAFSENLGKGNEKNVAEVSSHEAGHTFGLQHDGKAPNTEYYQGHGTGPTGWAPIMGVGYHKTITQWSQGEYKNARNYKNATAKQDDINVIAYGERSGAGFRVDDFGNSAASATVLSGGTLNQFGIITTRTDSDWFKFTTGATGVTNLSITTALQAWVKGTDGSFTSVVLPGRSPNLDIVATLYDVNGSGSGISTSNPAKSLTASFNNLTLTANTTYSLKVDGAGFGDPLINGYSDYGSLGGYLVTGTLV